MRISDWSSDVCSSDLVIGDDGPEVSPLRASPSGIEDRGGGLVHEQPLGVGQMPTHPLGDRPEVEAGATGPVAQGGPNQGAPLAAIDIGLTVEGQVVAELRRDDLGAQ